RQLRMTRPGTPDIIDISDGRFIDTDPAFTLDGLYLAFLSRRNFDPVYDTHFFDLSFPYGYRPFLVPLAADTPSPFGPLTDGRPANGRDDDGSKPRDRPATPDAAAPPAAGSTGDGAAAGSGTGGAAQASGDRPAPDRAAADGAAATPVKVDADGLAGRVIQVPVEESRYTGLAAVKGGLAWLRVPVTGNLGQGGATSSDSGPRRTLQRFDLTQRRVPPPGGEADRDAARGGGSRLLHRRGS